MSPSAKEVQAPYLVIALLLVLLALFLSRFDLPTATYSSLSNVEIDENKESKITSFFAKISSNNKNIIFTLTSIVVILSILGISRLEVENSFINYFNKNTEIYKGMKLIDDKLGGTTPLEVILKFPNKDKPNTNEDDEFEDWDDDETKNDNKK